MLLQARGQQFALTLEAPEYKGKARSFSVVTARICGGPILIWPRDLLPQDLKPQAFVLTPPQLR
jgi:hypothetical protein